MGNNGIRVDQRFIKEKSDALQVGPPKASLKEILEPTKRIDWSNANTVSGAGLSTSELSKIRNGQPSCSPRTIWLIAEALRVNLLDCLVGSREEKRKTAYAIQQRCRTDAKKSLNRNCKEAINWDAEFTPKQSKQTDNKTERDLLKSSNPLERALIRSDIRRILLYGPPKSGKSLILRKALEKYRYSISIKSIWSHPSNPFRAENELCALEYHLSKENTSQNVDGSNAGRTQFELDKEVIVWDNIHKTNDEERFGLIQAINDLSPSEKIIVISNQKEDNFDAYIQLQQSKKSETWNAFLSGYANTTSHLENQKDILNQINEEPEKNAFHEILNDTIPDGWLYKIGRACGEQLIKPSQIRNILKSDSRKTFYSYLNKKELFLNDIFNGDEELQKIAVKLSLLFCNDIDEKILSLLMVSNSKEASAVLTKLTQLGILRTHGNLKGYLRSFFLDSDFWRFLREMAEEKISLKCRVSVFLTIWNSSIKRSDKKGIQNPALHMHLKCILDSILDAAKPETINSTEALYFAACYEALASKAYLSKRMITAQQCASAGLKILENSGCTANKNYNSLYALRESLT